MKNLSIKNISKDFGSNKVLTDINIEVNNGEFFSIVGPSGCGKTTLLRIIAGLESASAGKIIINEKDYTKIPPQKRNVGIVFQNYALFPNMTVYENIAYGLEIKKLDKNSIKQKINSVLEKVQLSHKTHNNVTTLSGGEQQRVSLARVIVTEPDLILFDEPLSNLDYSLRLETRNELKRLQKVVGITSVYVTHDQTEALALSDRVAVLNKGVLQQTGNPHDIYFKPVNKFVAEFVGHANIFDEKQSTEIFNIKLKKYESIAVLPEEIIPVKTSQKSLGTITDIQFTGFSIEYTVRIEESLFKSLTTSNSVTEVFEVGDKVSLSLLTDKVRILNE